MKNGNIEIDEVDKVEEIQDGQINDSTLQALCGLRDRTLQKTRIAFSNRLSAIEQGRDAADQPTIDLLTDWFVIFKDLEKRAEDDIKMLCEDIPIVQEMAKVKGIGIILAAKVVAAVDIGRSDTVSALWRYAGFAVIDGQRERPTRGQKLHYNAELKKNLYLIGTSFVRSGSPYKDIYYSAKERYAASHPDWTKGHIDNAARRYMVKIFLSHLWEAWRIMEGLPTREAYVFEKLGHTHKYERKDFGWQI